MFSTNTELTKQVCKIIGANPDINFVKTMKRGSTIYVSATVGKPDEWKWLRSQCEKVGFIFMGKRCLF